MKTEKLKWIETVEFAFDGSLRVNAAHAVGFWMSMFREISAKHIHIFLLGWVILFLSTSDAFGFSTRKVEISGNHAFQSGELRLQVTVKNTGTKPICISSFSVYPSGKLDHYGTTTFETISVSGGPTSKAGKVLAIRVDPNKSVQFGEVLKPIPVSLIHFEFVGGSEGEEAEYRAQMNEEAKTGNYEMTADMRLGRCPRDTTLITKNGATYQELPNLQGHKDVKARFGIVKVPRKN